jgi:hypothetical protein
MSNFIASLALGTAAVAACGATAFAAESTTCSGVGQPMLTLSQGVDAAVIAAVKATLAASTLPGTSPKHNPGYKTVEDEAPQVEAGVSEALTGLGPLVDADFRNGSIQKATDAVTLEARGELQEALSYGQLSLRFEQILKARRAAAARVALGDALRAFGSSFATSSVYGSVNSQPFTATITRPAEMAPPVRVAPDATIEQTAEALGQEEARLVFFPYTFHPLVNRWVRACRAAHQLPQHSRRKALR